MSSEQQPSRNSFLFIRFSYFLASAFKKLFLLGIRTEDITSLKMHCRNTTELFFLWRCNTHTSSSQRCHARNQIHWTSAEWFTQTKWPQEKWKLFYQHGLKVFQNAQLWILGYSSSFPFMLLGSWKVLKVSLKKENSCEAFTWTHQGSIQVSNHPYPGYPCFCTALRASPGTEANRRCSKDKSALIHTRRKCNRKNKEYLNAWHGPCRSVSIILLFSSYLNAKQPFAKSVWS